MVKSEVIKNLKNKYPELNSSFIDKIFDIIFDTISNGLIKNQSIEIRDFGRFSIKIIKEKHNARNPKTNEVIYVPEKKKISFKMSKLLKETINENSK